MIAQSRSQANRWIFVVLAVAAALLIIAIVGVVMNPGAKAASVAKPAADWSMGIVPTGTTTSSPTIVIDPSVVPTGTATSTVTASATGSVTGTPTATGSVTSSPTATEVVTGTATASATATEIVTGTATASATATEPVSGTATSTVTVTATGTPPTATETSTATVSATPGGATATATNTRRPTITPRATRTATVTITPGGAPTASPTPCNLSFSDVHSGDYYYVGALYLVCHGIVSGYADGTYRPYNFTTRSQVVKIVVLAEGYQLRVPASPTFSDVPASNNFYPFIETAVYYQIISGYNDAANCGAAAIPCFKPYANVTRGQFSKILVIGADWDLVDPVNQTFIDTPPENPFYVFIETAAQHGVIDGYADGSFRWYNNATRGQIAKIVHLAITGGNLTFAQKMALLR